MPTEKSFRLAAVFAAALAASQARADPTPEHCAQHGAAATTAASSPGAATTDVTLADVPLVDQDGQPTRFPAAVGDGIVVMNFVFTTCTTVCPVLSSIFTGVQRKLGPDVGAGVRLVSLSLDPVRDTPARLKAYAAKHKAGPGWTWLTGEAAAVEEALRGAGAYTPDFQNHAPTILVGDARSGRWYRLNGFPSQDSIVEKVNELRGIRERSAAPGSRS